jgi:hypothetical protein
MPTFNAYAALAPHTSLQPFTFDPGELRAEEVEIEVSHCGMCHSDLSMLDNDWGLSTFPLVPRHEAVGKVVALGAESKGLKLGQRVGVVGRPLAAFPVTSACPALTISVHKPKAQLSAATALSLIDCECSGLGRPLPEDLESAKSARFFAAESPCSHLSSNTTFRRRPVSGSSALAVRPHGASIRQQMGLRSPCIYDKREQRKQRRANWGPFCANTKRDDVLKESPAASISLSPPSTFLDARDC